jgi:hypothetical protein
MVEWLTNNEKHVEGSGRGLILGSTPEFSWADWGKRQKTSARIPGLRVDTGTQKLGGLVRQRTIPTERPPLISEVSANFSW